MAMSAGAPCTALWDLFGPASAGASHGRVVHTSDRSVAILVGPGRLVVLDARPGPDSLPCSVLTPSLPLGTGRWASRVGEPVELSCAGLRGEGWRVPLVRWWSPARVQTGAGAPVRSPGTVRPAPLAHPLGGVLAWAVRAVSAGDVDAAVADVDTVLGSGPGSTPAADDAVAGLLLALRARTAPADAAALDEAATRIAERARDRTTALSAELLRHAATGVATQTVVAAVLRPTAASRARVLALGGTSGAALLAGIDLADAELDRQGAAA
ncbi:DUF2877 domain-containing protein [Angustibacter sp. McL0619]|uniref:oxamate carbamoyltransferase subunit AllH family protein n=1 Tax=Angustibacter sp. McL0619 TaxID=3415676 RepID=UPI003CED9CBC